MSDAQWTPIALSRALEPGAATGVVVAGRELVAWRDDAGRLSVWEDRCPHRGMRLSFGFIRGDRLACLYHGWQYDAGGQCRAIPAHPHLDPPKTIRTAVYPALETLGIIWVSLDSSIPAPIPLTAPAVTAVRSLALNRPLSAAGGALATADLPGFAGPASHATLLEVVADKAAVWTLRNGADTLLIAGQVVDEARCALHIVVLGAPAIYAGDGQVHVARWAERLRARAERFGAETERADMEAGRFGLPAQLDAARSVS
jgi:nitrite reductase/ring-hydroxylating ferredoxin subunit